MTEKKGIRKTYYFDNEKKYFVQEIESDKKSDNYDANITPSGMSYGNINNPNDMNAKMSIIVDNNTLKYLSLNPQKNKIFKFNKELRICYVEYKTPYYTMMYDFDFKKNEDGEDNFCIYGEIIHKYDYIVNYFINTINKVLNESSNANIEYIYSKKKNICDDSKPKGIHLYYPNIITDTKYHIYVCNKVIYYLLNDIDFYEKLYENEFDKDNQNYKKFITKSFDTQVAKKVGLRIFYNIINDSYYYPYQKKSTYIFEKNPNKHFKYGLINTDETKINFNINNDILNEIYNPEIKIKKNTNNKKKSELQNNDTTKEEISTFEYLNIGDQYDLFFELFDVLNPSRKEHYDEWYPLMNIFKTYNLKKEALVESKKYNGFDDKTKDIIDKLFDKPFSKERSLKFGTLIFLAKKDNPEKTKIIMDKYYSKSDLNITDIRQILLCNENFQPHYTENSKHISKNAIDIIYNEIEKNKNICIFIESPTGTGKTTCCIALMENIKKLYDDLDCRFLSIVTRQSMAYCHLSAFNYTVDENGKKVKNKFFNFVNYLDEHFDCQEQFICSLEHICDINIKYQIIILDEVFAFIEHFESPTLGQYKNRCLTAVLKLLSKAEIILCMDAMICDFHKVLFENRNYFFYRNTFQNKLNVPMNIFYAENNNDNSNIINYCDKYINKDVLLKKNILIICDLRINAEKIKEHLLTIFPDNDYFMAFNKNAGDLKDLVNINEIGINKCIIISPKIIYGVDILILYDVVHVFYKKTKDTNSMGAICMMQQISRSRNTKQVNILILDSKTQKYKNKYISFEHNKKIQYEILNFNCSKHLKLCNGYKIENTIKTTINSDGIVSFNDNDIFTKLFYYSSWYDNIFSGNKIDILKIILKNYGYVINETIFKNTVIENDLNLKIKELDNEIININKTILNENVYDNAKYSSYFENLKIAVKSRFKYLYNTIDFDFIKNTIKKNSEYFYTKINNIVDYNKITSFVRSNNDFLLIEKIKTDIIQQLIDIASNEKKFASYNNMKILKLNKVEFENYVINYNNNNSLNNIKNNTFKNIDFLFFIEKYLKINRFGIYNIKCENNEDIEHFKNFLLLHIDKLNSLYGFHKNNEKNKEQIITKINKINSLNLVQKFIVGLYNKISDVFYFTSKKITIDNKRIPFYTFFFNY